METENKSNDSSEIMKRCPFRKNADGEYIPYYDEECMAYLEYDQPMIVGSEV